MWTVHTGPLCSHIAYVFLHFQTSLGKLTPVANSFSPLLYSTLFHLHKAHNMALSSVWLVKMYGSEQSSFQTCMLSPVTNNKNNNNFIGIAPFKDIVDKLYFVKMLLTLCYL